MTFTLPDTGVMCVKPHDTDNVDDRPHDIDIREVKLRDTANIDIIQTSHNVPDYENATNTERRTSPVACHRQLNGRLHGSHDTRQLSFMTVDNKCRCCHLHTSLT